MQYATLAPPKNTVGTLRSDDGDGNGNATKAIGLISKTTILHEHHAFLYISLPSPSSDLKVPSGFIGQLVEHRTGNREVTGSNPLEVLNFFSGLFTQLHKLRSLRRSFLHFQT